MKTLLVLFLGFSQFLAFAQENDGYVKQDPNAIVRELLGEKDCVVVFFEEVLFGKGSDTVKVGSLFVVIKSKYVTDKEVQRFKKNRKFQVTAEEFYMRKMMASRKRKVPLAYISDSLIISRSNFSTMTLADFTTMSGNVLGIQCKDAEIKDL